MSTHRGVDRYEQVVDTQADLGIDSHEAHAGQVQADTQVPAAPTPRVRYTVLTGTPPFTVAPLSEMYQNIRDGRYPEPAHLSPNARRLIARLLAPNPAERPSLDLLLQDDFFTQVCAVPRVGPALGGRGPGAGRPAPRADPRCPAPKGFTPDRLPARSCYSAPVFTMPQPLGSLFRKVGRLLLTQCRPPCE